MNEYLAEFTNMSTAHGMMLSIIYIYLIPFIDFFQGKGFSIIALFLLIAVASLVAGIWQGFVQRREALLLFFLPFLNSELFAGLTGLIRESYGSRAIVPVLISFLIFQLGLVSFIIRRTGKPYLAVIMLSIFSMLFTMSTALVIAVALYDNWM